MTIVGRITETGRIPDSDVKDAHPRDTFSQASAN